MQEKKQQTNTPEWTQEYSPAEEIVHAITHGVGIPLGIAALVLMVTFSALYGTFWHVLSTAIYGTTLVVLFGASTLYHGWRNHRHKPFLQRLDHAAIFLLIAGTYTPFTLVTLNDSAWGWGLFLVVWITAAAGVWIELGNHPRLQRWSLLLYLLMGWVVILAMEPLVRNLARGGLWLLAAGGIVYTIGAGIYAWERLRWNHALWHLFVLAGSVLHFLAIFFYVVPDAPGR